jgi:hypothetical protein
MVVGGGELARSGPHSASASSVARRPAVRGSSACTAPTPVASADEIVACARRLLDEHWDRQRALRLVGVGAHNLVQASAATQMQFPLD